MTRFGLAVVLLLVALPAGAAEAAFEAPVLLGQGSYGASATAATDAAGRTTAILSGVRGGTRIVQRASSAEPWGPSQPLPGAALGRVAGPVVAAAGQGALAVAWRIDTPKKFTAIATALADPGEVLEEPIVASDGQVDGVRHPALAIDGAGRGVLAYNTGTRAVHLSLTGAIAVSLRRAGGAFSAPVIVDRKASTRPAAAIGEDGRGVVAWTHDRRVWATSFDAAAGTVGKVVALTGVGLHTSVVATAGPDGAATVAWLTHRVVGSDTAQTTRYEIQAVHRGSGGGPFPKTPLRITQRGYVTTLVMAADERGTTTVAWSQRLLNKNRSVGIRGITSTIQSATIGNTETRFRPALGHMPPVEDCATPAIAARAGRTVLAWSCNDRRESTVYTRSAALDGGVPATSLLSYRLNSRTLSQATPVTISLDATGTSTILATASELPDPTKPEVRRVLAITGR